MRSRKPRKQRKRQARAPLHRRHKMISANLSKELRSRFKKRSAPVRKGDTVKVLRGSHKRKIGKVDEVILKDLTITLENLGRKKVDGTQVKIPLKPSNVQIVELSAADGRRRRALERK